MTQNVILCPHSNGNNELKQSFVQIMHAENPFEISWQWENVPDVLILCVHNKRILFLQKKKLPLSANINQTRAYLARNRLFLKLLFDSTCMKRYIIVLYIIVLSNYYDKNKSIRIKNEFTTCCQLYVFLHNQFQLLTFLLLNYIYIYVYCTMYTIQLYAIF